MVNICQIGLLCAVNTGLKIYLIPSTADRNGVRDRDHSCPDRVGVHRGHGHHHVLLLRGAATQGEDGLDNA